jgi:N-acetyl-1-D-myo-inositol-2-amino-2-deoxy-alpha-D-glucopyranoside deacetylase
MAERPLTLMAIHAHPDDEAISTGGVLAKYADEGLKTVLVCATRGEEGEIHDPELDPEEAKDRLGSIREAELRRACDILGVGELYFLGYHDSGMAGTPANERPDNFHNADPKEAVGRLVRIIRRTRPEVVVTYDERGGYGHPDHIATHRTTLAAVDAAADPSQYQDDGLPAWQVQKLYYTAFPRSTFQRWREIWRELRPEESAQEQEDDFDFESFTVPDEVITTQVDVRDYLARIRAALLEHRTQIPADDAWMSVPDEMARDLMGDETFIRVRSLVPAPAREDDLFAGLRVERKQDAPV